MKIKLAVIFLLVFTSLCNAQGPSMDSSDCSSVFFNICIGDNIEVLKLKLPNYDFMGVQSKPDGRTWASFSLSEEKHLNNQRCRCAVLETYNISLDKKMNAYAPIQRIIMMVMPDDKTLFTCYESDVSLCLDYVSEFSGAEVAKLMDIYGDPKVIESDNVLDLKWSLDAYDIKFTSGLGYSFFVLDKP